MFPGGCSSRWAPCEAARWALGAFVVVLVALVAGCGGGRAHYVGGEDEPGADGDVDGDADADGSTDADSEAEPDGDPEEPFAFDPERVYGDVAYLASEELAGRAPGTAGNEAAVAFVEALFAELGLEPAGDGEGYRQAFAYEQWSVLGPATLAFDGVGVPAGDAFDLLAYSGSGEVTAEVVFAGHGLTVPPFDPDAHPDCPLDPEAGFDEYADLDVAGRVVLVLRHGPRDDLAVYESCPASAACVEAPCLFNFGYKARNAAENGAAAVLIVQDFRHDPEPLPGATVDLAYYEEALPVLFVDRRAVEAALPDLRAWADEIDETLAPASRATGVEASVAVAAGLRRTEADNVLAVLPGTDPDLAAETVVVGAHLDHLGVDPVTGEVFLGADDNASGTALLLELARGLVGFGVEPARTVLLAAWNAEEVGLIGSCLYVDDPVRPIADTVAALSIDMVGGGVGAGLLLYGATDPVNAWLADLMVLSARELGYGHQVVRGEPVLASDHACFALAGIPALLLSSLGAHPVYHTPQDTIDLIDVRDLESSLLMSWALLLPLALGTEDAFLGE